MKSPMNYTRNQAQRQIAQTSDPVAIRAFEKHQNSHVRKYAEHKLASLQKAEETKAKRSEASRKAAATRRAKKEAEQAQQEKNSN